nr:hypothetical protein [Tanacetum cinerariifolium]
MTGNLKLLINFVKKFLGTVKFGNDQIAPILGYGDLVQGAGNDLLTGSLETDLYSITLQDTTSPNPICLMAKATSSQAWLWHRRLSHLNFDTINLLLKNDIVTTPSSKIWLQLLHMDLCGPMRVASINGKRYALIIVDDYSIYTWPHFLRSKDETPEVLIDFLRLVQRGLHAQVRIVRTDKDTEFLNQTLHAYFAIEGILHQTSVARTPEQNGVVERRNRTLVEAARIMLSLESDGEMCMFTLTVSRTEPKNIKEAMADSVWIKSMHEELHQFDRLDIILFIVDFGCSKYMTGNLKLLINFVKKFLGTVKFGNDQIAPILGYGDLVQGAGNDLLTGSLETDLYSITLQDTTSPNQIFLMDKATLSQAWLWHRRLSHLNFDTINLLLKNDIVTTPSSKRWLQLLHMDLCGPMRVASINGKRYVLIIVDDYSIYTWTHFLRSKDETPEVLIDFLRLVQRGLHAQVRIVRTDKDTKFLNQTLHAYFAIEGILHQTSVARTPEQNGVVERRNRTFVEAARIMLSVAKVLLFFWAEAIAPTCFTQNRSLVIPRHEKHLPHHQ